MKTFTKSLLIIVGIMVVLGIGLSVAGLAMGKQNGFPSTRGGKSRVVCDDKNMEEFSDIKVSYDFGEVILEPSDSYGLKIVSSLDDEYLDYSNENGTLTVYTKSNNDLRHGIFSIDFSFLNSWMNGKDNASNESLTVYYPKNAEFDIVNLRAMAGRVVASDFSASDFVVVDDFGEVRLNNITAQTTNIKLSSGSFEGKNITTGKLAYENDFGSGEFESVTAEDATLNMSSGELRVDNSTFGMLDVDSDFGAIRIKGTSADKAIFNCSSGEIKYTGHLGEAEIDSDFGAVTLDLDSPRSDYSLDLSTDFGKVTVNGSTYNDGMADYQTGKPLIKVGAASGEIRLNFDGN